MADPLSDIISLLRPGILEAKYLEASEAFSVCRDDLKGPFYCMLIEGNACLEVRGSEPVELQSGDFFLIPNVTSFTYSSLVPSHQPNVQAIPVLHEDGVHRIGAKGVKVHLRQLMGYCQFASSDAHILLSLLPELIVVRDSKRLEMLAKMVREEISTILPARDTVIDHLLQLLLIEAFRFHAEIDSNEGLFKGLADSRIRIALHAMHDKPEYPWSIKGLASEAGMSRSVFFKQFRNLLGVTPMMYLLNWRMTLAKHFLNRGEESVSEIAYKLGYGSASAFSTAFTRYVGHAPSRYRELMGFNHMDEHLAK
ncbi:AraC family transcriptional regulator [Aliamphritea ceti]|uniref:AraC family transcriptional regulator n=1 Tax=Aliamphritea ceti TaxID=1524258 RepID=UPI0021C2E9E8|nr:AraC family transcriptional regulator [Aliamphritea ceti]